MGDFRSALTNEKETFTIYKTQLGEEHDKTRESGECLRHLTQQAVVLQKKMNDIYQGKTKSGLPPIQIQPPSMGSVLDMLNIINGILFVQISQADIENFKKEYETRQKDLPLTKQLESADMSLKAAEEAAAEASAAVSEVPAKSESPERLTEAAEAVETSS
jgi:protein TIF31